MTVSATQTATLRWELWGERVRWKVSETGCYGIACTLGTIGLTQFAIFAWRYPERDEYERDAGIKAIKIVAGTLICAHWAALIALMVYSRRQTSARQCQKICQKIRSCSSIKDWMDASPETGLYNLAKLGIVSGRRRAEAQKLIQDYTKLTKNREAYKEIYSKRARRDDPHVKHWFADNWKETLKVRREFHRLLHEIKQELPDPSSRVTETR